MSGARACARALGAALVGLVLVLALAGPAQAKRVRAFAVGPRFALDWVDTSAHYRAKLLALVDARRRAGAPTVQRGADDVASHLLGPTDRRRPVATARDLVVLPEDLGLMASFVGQRGEAARAGSSLPGAIVTLLQTYAPISDLYAARYPELAARPLGTRLLALALTDTFARTAVETFAELADRYDVYLEAGVNMAQDWRVVCASKAAYRPRPAAPRCDVEDPARVAQLRAPDEPTRTYAYEATSPKASNMALVFDPDGRLISKQVKTYLTPVELPGQLDLVPGTVSGGVRALRTPVGTLGFVTSKDAWMPDLTAKLDEAGVDVLVQPEFFVNDTLRTTGMWAPDNLTASGWSDLLRHPSMRSFVLPELTGNVYDFSADAQQHIARKPTRPTRGTLGLAGQPPRPGLVAVQRYLVPDPVGLPFPERRRRLGRAGEDALATGTGPACLRPDVAGPCKGGQVEGVLHADLEVDVRPARRPAGRATRGRGPVGVNRAIAPSAHRQRNVVLARRGRHVWAAFEERRGGRDRLVVARSDDGGRRFARLRAPRGRGDQWWPSLAVGPDDRLWLAWQERGRAWVATARRGGFGAPRALPAPTGAPQRKPSIAALGSGRAYVAWIDERERSADDALPQAHLLGVRVGPAGALGAPQRLDGGPPVELSAKLDHAWAPHVASRGAREVAVTWIDFRTYDWRAWLRTSGDGGATFAPERVLTDAPDQGDQEETLDDTPRATFGPRGAEVAFTDYRKRASSARVPHQLYDILLTRPGARPARVDPHRGAPVSTFAPWPAADGRRGTLVAWQDHARGVGEVRLARVAPSGARGPALRVQDAAARGNAWRPALAVGGARALVAWEDERDGPSQVYAAAVPTRRVR